MMIIIISQKRTYVIIINFHKRRHRAYGPIAPPPPAMAPMARSRNDNTNGKGLASVLARLTVVWLVFFARKAH